MRELGALSETQITSQPAGNRDETILVVEDNPDARAYSVMILRELGYTVLEAAVGDKALELVRGPGRIGLLFTDVVLPGKGGRVLTDEAAAIRPRMRVLFTAGYSRNAIIHHRRLDANVMLLTKPFTFEQLAVRIRDVLDNPKA